MTLVVIHGNYDVEPAAECLGKDAVRRRRRLFRNTDTLSQRQIDGAAVVRVEPNSRAFSSGLRPGDIVVAVNQRAIAGIDDFEVATKRPGRQLLLTIARGQGLYYVIIE